MKKIKQSLLSVFMLIFAGLMFSACDPTTITATFSSQSVSIEMNQEYDPFDFITEEIDISIKANVSFKTENSAVAYITPTKKLVASGYGATVLKAYYNNAQVAWCNVSVNRTPIQLTAPVNVRYDQTNHRLTWDYSYAQGVSGIYTATKYELILTKDNEELSPITISNLNYYSITNIGAYTAQVRTIAPNTDYISSDFPKNTSGEYVYLEFNLMGIPLELQFNNETNILTWNANGNPEETEYIVHYTFNQQEERTSTVSTNSCELEALTAGTHTVYVEVVPQDETYFASSSAVLTLQKLEIPTLTFNNGQVSWEEVDGAMSYTLKLTIGATTTSKVIYATSVDLSNKSAGEYTLTLTANGNAILNIFDSENFTKYFRKLPTAEIIYDTETKTFYVNNAEEFNYDITIRNDYTSSIDVSESESLVWSKIGSDPYSVLGQLFATDTTYEIDGNVATYYRILGSDSTLSKIQNLANPALEYSETNGNASISFTEGNENSSYVLYKNNVALDIELTDFKFELGQISEIFTTANTYAFEMKVSKTPTLTTYFVNISSFMNVVKIVNPTSIGLSGTLVQVKDSYPTGIATTNSSKIMINGVEANNLDLTVAEWNIAVNFVAKSGFESVGGIRTYYTSSSANNFTIERIAQVQNLAYDYTQNDFAYDSVANAQNYRFSANDVAVGSSTTTTFHYTVAGSYEMSVVAYPLTWTSINSSTTGYYASFPRTLQVDQTADISNLTLSKDDLGVVSASWIAPSNDEGFTKTINYSVYVNDDLIASDLTALTYEFSANQYNTAGNYVIKVKPFSPEFNFFASATETSVTLTRLSAPTTLLRSGNTLTATNFRTDSMLGLVVNDQFQTASSVSVVLSNGESRTLNIAFSGIFDASLNKYNLSSSNAIFNFNKLNEVYGIDLEISGDDYNFSWNAVEQFVEEEIIIIPEYLNFYYKTSYLEDGYRTSDNSVSLSYSNGAFTFFIKEVSSEEWTSITAGQTKYFDCDAFTQFQVETEEEVANLAMAINTDGDIEITWDYTPVYTVGSTYIPNFIWKFTDYAGNITTEIYETIDFLYEGHYLKIIPIETFANAGTYTIDIYIESTKTLKSSHESLTITTLAEIQYLSFNGTTATISAQNGGNLNMAGVSEMVVSGSLTTSTNYALDLSELTTEAPYEVSLMLKAIIPSEVTDGNYYLDGKVSSFKIAKLGTTNPTIAVESNQILWSEIPNADWYNLKIVDVASSEEFLYRIEENYITLNDSRLLEKITANGLYFISVMADSLGGVVGVYNSATELEIGYIPGDYADSVELSKLEQVSSVTVMTGGGNIYQSNVILQWVNVADAEKYNIYVSNSSTVRGDLLETVINLGDYDTIYQTTTAFADIGTYYVSVEATKSGAIIGNISPKTKIVRLNPLTSGSIDSEGYLTWTTTNQISTGTPFESYIVEVLNSSNQRQALFGLNEPIKNTYMDLSDLEFIDYLNGQNFIIKLAIMGTGLAFDNTITATLTSASLQIDIYKFLTPTISIFDNQIAINSSDIQGYGNDIEFVLSVYDGDTILLEDYIYNGPYEIPESWTNTNFTIKAYATSDTENLIKSKTATLSTSRLASPTNLVLEANNPSDLTQTDIKLTFDAVPNATRYNIFSNGEIFEMLFPYEPADTYSIVFTGRFSTSGEYNIQVKALSDNAPYSNLSEVVKLVRLNGVDSASINTEKVVSFISPTQNSSDFTYYLELFQIGETNTSQGASSTNLTETTYNGFVENTWLAGLEGGYFLVEISVIGNGSSNNADNTATFTSPIYELNALKLYVPALSIHPSNLEIILENKTLNTPSGSTISDEGQSRFTIITNAVYAKTAIGEDINKMLYSTAYYYPDNWTAGEYEITAYSEPKANAVNILPSNTVVKTTTRLETTTELKFIRTTLSSTDNYFNDADVDSVTYVSDVTKFQFTASANAVSYKFLNSQEEFLSGLQSIEINGDFGAFLHNGNGVRTLQVISVASSDNELYINSKSATIQYSTLNSIASFQTQNGSVVWDSQAVANCYLVRAIAEDLVTQNYWQSENGTTNTSILNGILTNFLSGQISLNIKAVGNISTTGLDAKAESIVLDGQYLEQNVSFTKLENTDNLRAYLGYLAFDLVEYVQNYVAYIYNSSDELLSQTTLINYKNNLEYEDDQVTFIGHSNDLTNLTKNTLYKIKIQSQSEENLTIYSDLSDFLYIKILENANPLSTDIKLENSPDGDLTKKKITATASANSYGLLVKNGDIISVAQNNETIFETATKLSFLPEFEECGVNITYTYASLGSSDVESEDGINFYYISSTFTTSENIYILSQTSISIIDGVIYWELVDGADGYYVYINNALYNNKIYTGTSLALPTSFGGENNTIITIEIISVSTDLETLHSLPIRYTTTQTYSDAEHTSDIELLKLAQPLGFDLSDGTMLWNSGISGLDLYNQATLEGLLLNLTSNLSDETINALESYIQTLFNSPLLTYSKYKGFELTDLILSFKNIATGTTYNVETSPLNFLKLTAQQLDNFSDLMATVLTALPIAIQSTGISSIASEKELYFGENQAYANENEYLFARLSVIYNAFHNDNLASLAGVVDRDSFGFPTLETLFEELNGDTSTIPGGNYQLTIQKQGNSFDWLDSSISEIQSLFIPYAPTSVEIFQFDGDFFFAWNKIDIPAQYNYSAKIDSETTSTSTVYILYGEDASGNRFELTRTIGTATQSANRLKLNLSNLIDSGVIGTDIVNLFLVVAGDNASVVSGLKSHQLPVTILAQLAPVMDEGEIVLSSEVSAYGFQIIASAEGYTTLDEIIQTSRWIGDTLQLGTSYNVSVRAIGSVYTDTEGNIAYVLSGKEFLFKIKKLEELNVSVNKYGEFNWAKIDNAKGFIVELKDTETRYVVSDNGVSTYYEAVNTGFNIFLFRALGSTGNIVEGSSTPYYLSSKINNDQLGLKGCMLSNVANVFIEEGQIKWTPLPTSLTQNISVPQSGMVKVIGYKLTIDNGIDVIYSTNLTENNYKADTSGNLCFDFTDLGSAQNYNIKIQPYIYFTNQSEYVVGTVRDTELNEYKQLLGVSNSIDFNKIACPRNIKIVNGEFAWIGNETDDSYYIEVMNDSGTIIKATTSEKTWWTNNDLINTTENYTIKIKAYNPESVFSVFTLYGDIDGVATYFKKLAFTKPTTSNQSREEGNFILFNLAEQGHEVGFNIKYNINNEKDEEENLIYNYLMVTDENYSNVVSYINGVVTINVNAIREDITTMKYYIQLVPLGETTYIKSNFTTELSYATPQPVQEVFYDSDNYEFYWAYQGSGFGYLVKDEIYDGENLVATYYYKIASGNLTTANFYKTRTINSANVGTINFAPTVVGYTHIVSVAVSTDPYAVNNFMSPYTESETASTFTLYSTTQDVFASASQLYLQTSDESAKQYLIANAYGSSGNPYIVANAVDFANLNKRLVHYSYQSSYIVEYKITIDDVETEKHIDLTDSSNNLYFKQTENISGITTSVGTRVVSGTATNYFGFANTYDGGNYEISYSLVALNASDKLGLFKQLETGGIVKNLSIVCAINFNGIASSSQEFGTVVSTNNGTVSHVTIKTLTVEKLVYNNVGLYQLEFGGIVCRNNGTVEYGTIQSGNEISLSLANGGASIYAGYIVAKNYGTIQYCGNQGNLEVEARNNAYVGGIVGYNTGNIFSCYNNSTISARCVNSGSNTYVGGIVGSNEVAGTIFACYVKGSINALNNGGVTIYAGGIAGNTTNRNVGNCYSELNTIVIQTDSGGTATKFGGTLFGQVAGNVTTYKNYFINDHAVGLGVSLITDFTIKYNLAENGINGLLTLLNAGYTTPPFTISGANIVLSWQIV